MMIHSLMMTDDWYIWWRMIPDDDGTFYHSFYNWLIHSVVDDLQLTILFDHSIDDIDHSCDTLPLVILFVPDDDDDDRHSASQYWYWLNYSTIDEEKKIKYDDDQWLLKVLSNHYSLAIQYSLMTSYSVIPKSRRKYWNIDLMTNVLFSDDRYHSIRPLKNYWWLLLKIIRYYSMIFEW